MMARFCRYVEKVFGLSNQLKRLRDSRSKPQIPTATVFLSVLMMFVTRLGSVNGLEAELRVPKRWDAVVGRRKPSADSIARVVGLMDPECLRDLLSSVNHQLRRNKALDDHPWGLRFLALDGHEFFSQ